MKIYKTQIPQIATELVKALIDNKAIEVVAAEMDEIQLDVESVLRSYVEMERQIHEEAQDIANKRSAEVNFPKIKRDVARKYNFGIGEDAMDWITDQLIEMLLHTSHVDEVWADDCDIRRIARPVIQKNTEMDDKIDLEVRKKIKNLTEGSVAWDIKYQQVLDEVKRNKGIK